MERVCVYPGSFDPLTVGHADLIRTGRVTDDEAVLAAQLQLRAQIGVKAQGLHLTVQGKG